MSASADLFKAAESGKISAFRMALGSGADINAVSDDGSTPLIIACKLGYTELVKFIISKGAEIDIIDKKGLCAKDYAELSKNQKTIDFFQAIGVTIASNQSINKTQDIEKLSKNLFPVLKSIHDLTLTCNDEQKEALSDDFLNTIVLFRQDKKLSFYDGFGLTLALSIISDPDEFARISNQLNDAEEVTKTINVFLNSISHDIQNADINFSNYELISLTLFTGGNKEKVKHALYEFSEIIIKADGIVTEQEAKALKFVSNSIFKQMVPSTQIAQENQEQTDIETIMNELNSLVGMANIKADIQSLINIININKLRKNEDLPELKLSLHSVFIGPPGTGKTTIARILSKVYHALEILPENNFVETDRSGLVAGYVGQTAIKTDNIVNQALNGVLFIDEAYMLKRGDSDNDYGQEAIDILLKRMEDNRDNLIIIVAGYEKEMVHFINSNPGLKSRFNRYFYFNDYSPQELTEIFKRMAEKYSFIFSENSINRVTEIFEILCSRKDDKFGNARLARNIIEKTFQKHADRTATITPITREILTTIEPEDIPFDEFVNSKN
jgi:Holliday junction resolvasome RuvABC ATP-dependent DNA helicase subunit